MDICKSLPNTKSRCKCLVAYIGDGVSYFEIEKLKLHAQRLPAPFRDWLCVLRNFWTYSSTKSYVLIYQVFSAWKPTEYLGVGLSQWTGIMVSMLINLFPSFLKLTTSTDSSLLDSTACRIALMRSLSTYLRTERFRTLPSGACKNRQFRPRTSDWV